MAADPKLGPDYSDEVIKAAEIFFPPLDNLAGLVVWFDGPSPSTTESSKKLPTEYLFRVDGNLEFGIIHVPYNPSAGFYTHSLGFNKPEPNKPISVDVKAAQEWTKRIVGQDVPIKDIENLVADLASNKSLGFLSFQDNSSGKSTGLLKSGSSTTKKLGPGPKTGQQLKKEQ